MKLTKPIIVLLILASGIVSCSRNHEITPLEHQWLAQQDSLVVSVFPYYAPYQFKNKNKVVDGIFVDYLELLEQKMDYKFKRVQYSNWSKLLEDVEAGKIDVVLEIQPTKERSETLTFYELNFQSSQTIVGRKNSGLKKNLSDYKGKTITLPKEYVITETIRNKHPEIKIVEHESDSVCLKLLNDGKYEAFIGPRAVVHHYRRTDLLNNITIVGKTPYYYNPGIAVQKNNTTLNTIFKKATASVSKKERNLILSNWLFMEIKPFYTTAEFWIKLSLVGLFIVLCITAFNRYLKFKVDQRTKDLQLAKEKAEESNILKGQFIRNISHEIRTPLNGILGFSELLQPTHISEEKIKKHTTNISTSAKRLTEVVDTILEVANLQSQEVSTVTNFINIEELLTEVIKKNLNRAAKKNLSMKFLPNNYFPNAIVGVDKEKLQIALEQIIDNAIKFTEQGAVLIAYELTNMELKIIIKDTGIGITTNNEEVIFKSFAQLQHEISKKYSGLGLGLTIARENILLMGGTITYVSKAGEGSVFTIKLPYVPINS